MKKPPLFRRLKRALVELIGSGGGTPAYAGADVNRLLMDWIARGMVSDEEVKGSAERLRWRARDLERNNSTIRQYLRMLAINVIGPEGIRLQAQVRGRPVGIGGTGELKREVNRKIEAAWYQWGQEPTVDGRTDFNGLCRQLLRTVARDGEAFVRIWRGFDNPFGLALEAVDADLIDITENQIRSATKPAIRMGIIVDDNERPTAYRIWSRPPRFSNSSNPGPNEVETVSARQIIHLYDPERVDQVRGVSWLAPVVVPALMLEKYRECELVAARVGAAKMAFFQRKQGGGLGDLPVQDNRASLDVEIAPGTFGILPDGYEVADWNPEHPNTAFSQFIKDTMRQIATGLGVSYNSLASDLEGVNYSSMRSGLGIERDVWRVTQSWWICRFMRPVYREFLNQASLSGVLGLGIDSEALGDHRWIPRGWPPVDPEKDIQAEILAIQNGLGSRQRFLGEQGIDFEETIEQLEQEQEIASEYGVEITAPDAPAPPQSIPVTPQDGEGRAIANGHARRF